MQVGNIGRGLEREIAKVLMWLKEWHFIGAAWHKKQLCRSHFVAFNSLRHLAASIWRWLYAEDYSPTIFCAPFANFFHRRERANLDKNFVEMRAPKTRSALHQNTAPQCWCADAPDRIRLRIVMMRCGAVILWVHKSTLSWSTWTKMGTVEKIRKLFMRRGNLLVHGKQLFLI